MSINSAPTTTTTNVTLSGINVTTNVSGQTVSVASGIYLASGVTMRAGLVDATAGTVINTAVPSSDTITASSVRGVDVTNFNYAYEPSAAQWARMRITASGQGISGITHRLVVGFSGDTSYEYGTVVRAHPFTVVTNLSGGTEAGSGTCFGATIRNHSGNGPMLLGGTGTEAPFSGKGMIVYGGESYDLKVDNFNKVRALAYTSGQLISVAGVDK